MLASFVSSITAFITAHPHLAYAAVLLLALSESIPVLGVVVPGSAVIVALGALVPTGAVTLWPLLIAAVAGAIMGDGVSYWIGHRYHRAVLDFGPLHRYAKLIVRSEAFFARHGAKSVFLARFTPGVRAFVPLMAGILQMSPLRFYVANLLSALIWAPAHVLSGVLVGSAITVFGAAAKPLGILVVLLLVLTWATVHIVRFALRRGPPLFSAGVEWLRASVAANDSRWAQVFRGLLDPSRSEIRALAALGLLLVGAVWLFLGILEDVISGDPLVRADTAIYNALQDLRTGPGDAVMIAITELGDTVVGIAVAGTVLLWLLWRRAWRTAGYWLGAVAGAMILNGAVKAVLHRARPGELLYSGWSVFSFPSGHSTINAVLYGFLAFLIARELKAAWRASVVVAAVSFVLLIAISRLYLGAHWLSDVAGGLAFGTAWLAALGFFYLRRPSEPIAAHGLAVAGTAALALVGWINIDRHHAFDVKRYAVADTVPTMPLKTWWTTGWEELPVQRIDLTGEIEEPLTIHWAGDLGDLQSLLAGKGWRVPAPWTATTAMTWLSASVTPEALPVVPRLSSGRLPSLTMVMVNGTPAGNSRYVLRLWRVDLTLTNSTSVPLWIGSVVEEHLERPMSLITLAFVQANMNAPRNSLAGNLRSEQTVLRTAGIADADWDGGVLLVRREPH
jgi:undecaprenyl-diphosphatase